MGGDRAARAFGRVRYEQLGAEPIRTVDLPHLCGLSDTATDKGLKILGEFGVAERLRIQHSWWRAGIQPATSGRAQSPARVPPRGVRS
ncbi:hypothetical protein GCM10018965_006790 [Nonomuraea roseola]